MRINLLCKAFERRKNLLLSTLLLFSTITFCCTNNKNKNGEKQKDSLPLLGPKKAIEKKKNGEAVIDSVPHKVPEFSFIDQNGNTFTHNDLKNKIYIAEYFFTTCPTICPKMTKQLKRVQTVIKDKNWKNVHILSHTVDPKHDTAEVLKKYALKHNADTSLWHFVTGNRNNLYELGRKGYFMSTKEAESQPGGYLHSGMFALVDKNRHIRGYYDGTNPNKVDEMLKDIQKLISKK